MYSHGDYLTLHLKPKSHLDRNCFSGGYLKFPTPESADQVTRHVNTSLAKIFPSPASVCLIRHGTVETPETPRDMSPNSESSSSTTHSICGGFSETYAALCDYNGHSCREEVQWDVDTIYHSEDNREFNLLDFCHLESRDLALIVAALAYNQWFTKLYCKDLRLGSEVAEQVLHTVSKSHHLEELVLDNAGLKTDFALKLACVLAENPNAVLHALTLSHNPLEDKGLSALSQQLLCFPKGLSKLCLSKTSITAKGLAILCQTFGANPAFTSSLRHLDLSKNPGLLGTEEANGFYSFLAQPNALVHLDLSSTDCAVDALFGALLHGCCPRLSYLNLARNTFSHRKGKGLQPSLKQFFCSAYSLTYVNLSGIKMPVEALRSLFQGLSANTHLSELHLDLSGCELRSPGAQVLQEQLSGISALSSLDLSDNGFDADLLTLVPALGRNKSLKHLWLGKNFNVKSRTLEEILQKIVQVIQEEECSLQSFSVADSRLKTRTSILINALGSNTCLTKVDLSGNCMEDIGAKMLSKALQINSTLRWAISWDKNNTTAQGFQDIARALENNYTLKFMSFPMSDITAAYRNAPERTDEVWQKIQWCLLRNNHSQKFPQEQAFRLHQGIVTNSAEQMMSRLCVRVQEEVRLLRTCSADTIQEEVLYARELMKEAKNSRALFPSLYELGHILASDGPVRHRLESVANEVSKAVDKELQVILESMVSLTQELCPHAVQAAEEHNKMLAAVSERVTVPRNFIRGALLEQAGQDIQNKLNEVKLSVVTYLTNTIVEELLQELYYAHKSLVRASPIPPQITHPGQVGKPRLHDHEETTDDELGSSIDTMAIKRRKNCRRIRPASAFISGSEQDGDLVVPRMDSPLGWISLASSSQYLHSRSTSFEALSDLPTEGARLEHRTRSRPRPPRATPQGRFRPSVSMPHTSPCGFRALLSAFPFLRLVKKDSPPSVPPPFPSRRYPRTPKGCGVRPGPSDPLPPLQKKRRRGLFHFRKHRSIKGERDPEDLPPSPPPPPTGGDDQKPPLRPSGSQEEERRLGQDGLGAQFRDPPPAPRPPKPVALPRGRKPPSQPERSRSNEEAGGAGGGAVPEETRTSPPIAQPRRRAEERENEGDVGRKAAPLKPKRTRRAQSCDKLESDRGRNPGSGGEALLPTHTVSSPWHGTWKGSGGRGAKVGGGCTFPRCLLLLLGCKRTRRLKDI
uniref:Capping protein regulator and myosin 1 linker 3 n=1 Tax=Podarcis muralis TaxID=64176 RepID=A0A670K9F7_PODMU